MDASTGLTILGAVIGSASPKENIVVILNHVMFGLAKEDLIGEGFHFGPKDFLVKIYGEHVDAGIVFAPSALGVEVFLWAYGRGDLNIADFLDPEIKLVSNTKLATVPGFKAISKKSDFTT